MFYTNCATVGFVELVKKNLKVLNISAVIKEKKNVQFLKLNTEIYYARKTLRRN